MSELTFNLGNVLRKEITKCGRLQKLIVRLLTAAVAELIGQSSCKCCVAGEDSNGCVKNTQNTLAMLEHDCHMSEWNTIVICLLEHDFPLADLSKFSRIIQY